MLGHGEASLHVPYPDCQLDPHTISEDMLEADHPSSYHHYELPASTLERQGNTPQSQRRPAKHQRSLPTVRPDWHSYGSVAEDQVSGALESRPRPPKPLKGGVSKGVPMS
jgi:hypothetical protein